MCIRDRFEAVMKDKKLHRTNRELVIREERSDANRQIDVFSESALKQIDTMFPKRKDSGDRMLSKVRAFPCDIQNLSKASSHYSSINLPEVSFYNCIISPFDQRASEFRSVAAMKDRARRDFRFPSNAVAGRLRTVSTIRAEASCLDRAFFENTVDECVGYNKVGQRQGRLARLNFPGMVGAKATGMSLYGQYAIKPVFNLS
eukprot:TRINITY_DN5704_c0_g1_i15.p1 TRINITY_DN5704_c0_g1~~TRINITY_DN5704_c0_g1_i15.p1  ORF type:complete len:202 (-),score=29.48 TRINITY_DN5704_c0_g1_i15:126-731(-)